MSTGVTAVPATAMVSFTESKQAIAINHGIITETCSAIKNVS